MIQIKDSSGSTKKYADTTEIKGFTEPLALYTVTETLAAVGNYEFVDDPAVGLANVGVKVISTSPASLGFIGIKTGPGVAPGTSEVQTVFAFSSIADAYRFSYATTNDPMGIPARPNLSSPGLFTTVNQSQISMQSGTLQEGTLIYSLATGKLYSVYSHNLSTGDLTCIFMSSCQDSYSTAVSMAYGTLSPDIDTTSTMPLGSIGNATINRLVNDNAGTVGVVIGVDTVNNTAFVRTITKVGSSTAPAIPGYGHLTNGTYRRLVSTPNSTLELEQSNITMDQGTLGVGALIVDSTGALGVVVSVLSSFCTVRTFTSNASAFASTSSILNTTIGGNTSIVGTFSGAVFEGAWVQDSAGTLGTIIGLDDSGSMGTVRTIMPASSSGTIPGIISIIDTFAVDLPYVPGQISTYDLSLVVIIAGELAVNALVIDTYGVIGRVQSISASQVTIQTLTSNGVTVAMLSTGTLNTTVGQSTTFGNTSGTSILGGLIMDTAGTIGVITTLQPARTGGTATTLVTPFVPTTINTDWS